SSSSSIPSPSCRRIRPRGGSEPDHPLPLVAARAVAVLRSARATLPLRPPDPLQVVDLDHDEDRDRDEDLRLRHGRVTIALRGESLKGRSAYSTRRRGLLLGREGPEPEAAVE